MTFEEYSAHVFNNSFGRVYSTDIHDYFSAFLVN